jgi:hypothetical protein
MPPQALFMVEETVPKVGADLRQLGLIRRL